MISCSHTAETIGNWLRSFRFYIERELKSWPIINTIVTDFSFAQLNAILDAFNRMDVVEYLNLQYEFALKGVKNKNIVNIHLCVAHLMHCIASDVNDHYRIGSKPNKVIKEVFASIILAKDYNEVKKIWTNMSIVFKNKFITSVVIDALSSISSISGKLSSIKMENQTELFNIVNENDNRTYNKTLYSQSPFYRDFNAISDSIEPIDDKSSYKNLNLFYDPVFMQKILKKYISYLPFYCGVFHSEKQSNSYVENYFGLLRRRCKNSLHLGKLPTKPLRFLKDIRKRNLQIFTRMIYAIPKKNFKVYPKQEIDLNSVTEITSETTFAECLNKVENWKGQVKQSKSTKKRSYFSLTNLEEINNTHGNDQKCKVISYLNNSKTSNADNCTSTIGKEISGGNFEVLKKTNKIHLPILPNGNTIEKYHKNTCAFDSFSQCFLNCVELLGLHVLSDVENNDFAVLIRFLLQEDIKSALDQRYNILLRIYEGEPNCFSSVLKTPNNILNYFPSLLFSLKCDCCEAEYSDQFKYIPIKEGELESKGVSFLSKCIDEPRIKNCPYCSRESTIVSTLTKPIIFFYVEPFGKNTFKKTTISKIPKTIIVQNIKYKLNSFIHFIKNHINPELSHYVSYCLRTNTWECYDNLNPIVKQIRNENNHQVLPHLLFYTKEEHSLLGNNAQ